MELGYIFSVALLSAAATSVVGFGAGPISLVLLLIFLEPIEAITFSTMIVLATSLSKVLQFRRSIQLSEWWIVLPSAAAGALGGAKYATLLNSAWLEFAISVMLIFAVHVELKTGLGDRPPIWLERAMARRASRSTGYLLAGIISGVANASGAMLSFLVNRSTEGRERIVANIAVIALTMNVTKQIFFSFTIAKFDVKNLALVSIAAFVGTWLGKVLILRRISDSTFAFANAFTILFLLMVWGFTRILFR